MRPESIVFAFLFISWLITLGYIIYWGKKPFFINSPSYKLPSLFLELSSDLRRLSLDLAWKLGLEQISSFPFSSVGKKLYSKLFFAASSILIFIDIILIWLDKSEPSDAVNCYMVFLLVTPVGLLYKYYERKKMIAQSVEEDKLKEFSGAGAVTGYSAPLGKESTEED